MKKFISIVLSVILLASHMSLVIGSHFCEGEILVHKVLIGEAYLGCNIPDMQETCTHSEHHNNESYNVPCCDNEYQTIQTTSEYVKDATQITLNSWFALAAFYTTLSPDQLPKVDYQSEILFIPPPIEEDIQVLFQTFLI